MGNRPPALSEAAAAKINLYLHVTGRRGDGFHMLDSLMAFAGVGDSLSVGANDSLDLVCDGPFAAEVPVGDQNIVLKAARTLAEAAGVRAGAAIRLTKRLPPASGIGGGSADAAAALHALSRLWRITVEPPRLQAIALSLGADVPICLRGEAAFVSGIGETFANAPPLPPAWLVLANPLVPSHTAEVFRARGGPFSDAAPFTAPIADAAALAAVLRARRNDLTGPAVALVPAIAAVLEALEGTRGMLLARLSGSGATGFALYGTEAEADAAAAAVTAAHPEWWVAAAPLLHRAADAHIPAPPALEAEGLST